ncbi:MAG: ABC transporter, partial [Alphaproteobacteria bacterium]|nr:ABC transporter [Alphaproteobacteria bacterium]
ETKKPVIGLLAGLPMQGAPPSMMNPMAMTPPWTILAQMRQVFDVKTVRPGAARIEDDITVLMIAHPKDLPQDTLYAIDQFVMRGGKVLAFVDPYSEVASQQSRGMMGMPMPEASKLDPLLAAWGVEVVEGKFVGDRRFATRVSLGQRAQRRQLVDYIAWHATPEEAIARDDVVSGELTSLNFGTPGAIVAKEGASTKLVPLVKSSADAALVEAASVMFGPDPERLLRDFKAEGGPFVIAARIQGPAKTAFPDGPPKPEAKEGDKKEAPDADKTERPDPAAHLAEAKGPINVILVADTDMLDDRFWVQTQDFLGERIATPFNGNGGLVINALDNLTGSDDLISLRSRAKSQRPFTRIAAIRQDAETAFREKEKALQSRLEETEKKIAELQKERPGAKGQILSPEQRQAVDAFRQELLETRKELRDVQYTMQKDVDRLASRMKMINIGLIPALVAVIALALAWFRLSRRQARRAQA